MRDFSFMQVHKEKSYILIQGDLSGIQNYILKFQHQATSGLAKILRARSFYLSLISRSIEHKILSELHLPLASVVMSAGSKFLLAGEYAETHSDKLSKIQTDLDTWLLNRYLGDITFLLAWNQEPISGEQILTNFKEASKDVRRFLDHKKNQKLKLVLATDKKWNTDQFQFLQAYNSLLESGECAVQGFYPSNNLYPYSDTSKDKYLSEVSFQERETGEDLPHSQNHFVHFKPKTKEDNLHLPFNTTFSFELKSLAEEDFGVESFAPANLPSFSDWNESPEIYENKFCISCNEYKKVENGNEKSCEILGGFKEDNKYKPQSKSFHCLAQESKTESKFKKETQKEDSTNSEKESLKGEAFLGIFKADLDNAGAYFQTANSMEDYHKMSNELNSFFSSKLNALIQQNKIYKSRIYTVFAGGDDLFLIGTYTTLLDFIQDFQMEFKKTFGDKLTFSAGFSLTKPRTPIQIGASKAEQELKLSKDYKKADKEKNAISIFGTTMSWEEYKEALKGIKELIHFIERGLSVSFLYRLLHFYKENNRAANDPKAVIWKSHFAYAKARNIWQNKQLFSSGNTETQNQEKTKLDTFISNLLSEKKIHYANVILQLAIYQSRN